MTDGLSQGGSAAPSTPARGWHRTVGWPALIGVSLVTALLWLSLMSAVWGQVRREWVAVLAVAHQPLSLRLPAGLQAQASIAQPVHTRVRSNSVLDLALDQAVRVQLPSDLQAQAQVRAVVPVRTRVEVVAQVPVQTEVTLEVPLVRWLPRFTVVVPLSTVLPLRVSVPVALDVPVSLDAQVQARLPESVRVPVTAHFKAPLAMDQPLQAQVVGETLFTLNAPVAPMNLRIEEARFLIPMTQFGWHAR